MTDIVALFERGVVALEKLAGANAAIGGAKTPAPAKAATAPATNGATAPKTTTKPAPAASAAKATTAAPAKAPATKANVAAGAPVVSARKSPKGTPESAVVAALRKVKDTPSLGGDAVRRILNEAGATNIATLKPDMFDGVIEACNAEFDGEGESDGAAGAEDDPTAGL